MKSKSTYQLVFYGMVGIFLSILTMMACQKDITENRLTTANEVTVFLNEHGVYDLSAKQIERAMQTKSYDICYNVNDLLNLLSEYGTITPDIIPSIPGSYFQDGNCSVAKWTAALSERDIVDSTANSTIITASEILWYLDDDPPINTGNSLILPFYTYNSDSTINTSCPGIFQPSCNGTHTVSILMKVNNATFVRGGTATALVNNIPTQYPVCNGVTYDPSDLGTFDFTCFCQIKFEPYQFLMDDGLDWDLNSDHSVTADDLLIFLTSFGC